ncbi:MAG TPA: hypothetical protein VH008_07120, partial [Pseudonocardia sp.]|nr:hypothetical protein [Pseudonocardia sp.]
RDLSSLALEQLERVRDLPEDKLPPLGPHVLLGEGFRAKVTNLADALRRDLVVSMQLVATK